MNNGQNNQEKATNAGPVEGMPCLLCGSRATGIQYREARDYVTKEVFQVVLCKTCGGRCTHPQPANMDPYYPTAYRKYNSLVMRVLTTLYSFQVARWKKMFPQPGSALEMGCGDGLMLDALRRAGWKVKGTERTAAMVAFARDTLGLDVSVGGLETIPKEQKFNLIILFQVLEHLSDPMHVMKQCSQLLAPDGKLVIAVPNSDSWQARFAGAKWFHLDVPRHLFHYSPRSLNHALKSVGLGNSRISYISFEHDPFGWIQSLLNTWMDDRNGLTRFLMRLDGFSPRLIVTGIVATVLLLPSLFLSTISWIFGRGAIMQLVCSHAIPDAHLPAGREVPYA